MLILIFLIFNNTTCVTNNQSISIMRQREARSQNFSVSFKELCLLYWHLVISQPNEICFKWKSRNRRKKGDKTVAGGFNIENLDQGRSDLIIFLLFLCDQIKSNFISKQSQVRFGLKTLRSNFCLVTTVTKGVTCAGHN